MADFAVLGLRRVGDDVAEHFRQRLAERRPVVRAVERELLQRLLPRDDAEQIRLAQLERAGVGAAAGLRRRERRRRNVAVGRPLAQRREELGLFVGHGLLDVRDAAPGVLERGGGGGGEELRSERSSLRTSAHSSFCNRSDYLQRAQHYVPHLERQQYVPHLEERASPARASGVLVLRGAGQVALAVRAAGCRGWCKVLAVDFLCGAGSGRRRTDRKRPERAGLRNLIIPTYQSRGDCIVPKAPDCRLVKADIVLHHLHPMEDQTRQETEEITVP